MINYVRKNLNLEKELSNESHRLIEKILKIKKIKLFTMNVYVFWLLFLSLWAIVPLMIIKGRVDEIKNVKTVPEVKAKKKGWFN